LDAATPDLQSFLGELRKKSREQKRAHEAISSAPTKRAFPESVDAVTLSAAMDLRPAEMSTAPSAKFLEAYRAYEKAKRAREAEKALREQRKRKPPW